MTGRRAIVSVAAFCALAGAAAANPGGYKCPCGPIGMPATKYTTMYPNGDKFKMVCTNESPTGNFQSKYCKAAGGQVCIGECIYVGGTNMICYTYDAAGNPCTITHKNNKPDGTKKKVYVYDVKGGTVTTTCYKWVAGMGWMVDGRPTCRRVSTVTGEAFDATLMPDPIEEMLTDTPGLKNSAVRDTAVEEQAQSADYTAVAESNLPSGARDIQFFSSAVNEIPLRIGDRFVFHGVGPDAFTRINGKFDVQARADGLGTDLVSLVDGYIVSGETIARIGTLFVGPFDIHANSAGSPAVTERLIAAQCVQEVIPVEFFDEMSVDTYANILAPPSAPDLNHDGRVDSTDLAIVLGSFGATDGIGDASLDGLTDAGDIVTVLGAYGFVED